MPLALTKKRLIYELINGKCSLTLTPINKEMKLSSLENQIQKTFPVSLLNSTILILLNVPIKNI